MHCSKTRARGRALAEVDVGEGAVDEAGGAQVLAVPVLVAELPSARHPGLRHRRLPGRGDSFTCATLARAGRGAAGRVGRVIASHAHRFIFLKTRKTAGTSVEIALSKVCGPDDVITLISPEDEELRTAAGGRGPQNFQSPPLPRKAFNHMSARLARDAVGPDAWRDYYKFAIERNPWDAVVSLYYWKYKDREELPDFDTYVSEEWIEQLANNRRMYRIRGRLAVDRVLRYEHLDTELAEVWDAPRPPGRARPAARQGQRPPRRSLPRALLRRLPRPRRPGLRRRHRGLRLRVLSERRSRDPAPARTRSGTSTKRAPRGPPPARLTSRRRRWSITARSSASTTWGRTRSCPTCPEPPSRSSTTWSPPTTTLPTSGCRTRGSRCAAHGRGRRGLAPQAARQRVTPGSRCTPRSGATRCRPTCSRWYGCTCATSRSCPWPA